MLIKNIAKILLLSFILLLAVAVGSVSAQDEIECGDIIEEELEDEMLSFILEIEEESVVIVVLESDDFDSYLEIYDEDGDLYAQNDDGAGDLNSRLVLAEAGEYEVVVTSFDDEEGDFTLSVTCIEDCDVIEDELEDDDTALRFDIEADEDDTYLFHLASDDVDSYLYLLDEDEDIIEENDDGAGDLNSLLIYTFEDDGDYIIEATSWSGDDEGDFTLTICEDAEDVAEVSSDLDGFEVLQIECGDSIDGSIDDDTFIIFYLFEGAEGDEVTITMTAQDDGDLDPLLFLYDSDGFAENDILAENDDTNGLNSEIVYELENDDNHIIAATRFNIADGSSEGNFELELECD